MISIYYQSYLDSSPELAIAAMGEATLCDCCSVPEALVAAEAAAAAAAVAGAATIPNTGCTVEGVADGATRSVLTCRCREVCLWYTPSHGAQNVSLQSLQNFVAIDPPHIWHSKPV